MRSFTCPACGNLLFFENSSCLECGTPVAYSRRDRALVALDGRQRCANAALAGCNWVADDPGPLCGCCALTRTRPADGDAVEAFARAEAAKRRLVHQLDDLGLPTGEVVFDLLSSDAEHVITGHASGVITIDLAEGVDSHREAMRAQLAEPYRTLLGHFRHEVGHFYWEALIDQAQLIGPFRLIFGDESVGYALALANYHNRSDRAWNSDGFISEYATAHPWEDWAETFAHFLHIVSTLDTASSLPLSLDERARHTLEDPYLERDFEALLSLWEAVAYSMNELNRSMGLSDAYPFHLTPAVRGKLHFVHLAIMRARNGSA